jgi:LmbE family N-acetylglucosaminyl deacetylase
VPSSNPLTTLPVLALFAHPDDETFGPGGTLAALAAAGHPVHLLCATRGEAGTIGESASLGRERLAAVREEELRAACLALGLRPPRQLGLPDGGLADLDPDLLLRPFLRMIRAVRPAVIVTFHANGISGHRDHRTVTRLAGLAFERAADSRHAPELGSPHAARRLWTYALDESRARRVTYRKLHAVPDAEVDAEIDIRAFVAAKRAAVAAHATQRPFMDHLEEHVGDLEGFWNPESFVLTAARDPLPPGERPVRDLFAGWPPR